MRSIATLGDSRGADTKAKGAAFVAPISGLISRSQVKRLEKLASPFSLRFPGGGDGVEHRGSELFSVSHSGAAVGACCSVRKSYLKGCRDCKYHPDTDNAQICISSSDDP